MSTSHYFKKLNSTTISTPMTVCFLLELLTATSWTLSLLWLSSWTLKIVSEHSFLSFQLKLILTLSIISPASAHPAHWSLCLYLPPVYLGSTHSVWVKMEGELSLRRETLKDGAVGTRLFIKGFCHSKGKENPIVEEKAGASETVQSIRLEGWSSALNTKIKHKGRSKEN